MSPTRKRWIKRAAIAGALLGLLCPALPAQYQAPCRTIAAICTGGL